MRFQELQFLWKALKAAALVVGVFLSFFAVIEFIRAYTILAGLHPYAGYAFLAVSAAVVAGTTAYVIRTVYSKPRVIKPPVIRDTFAATCDELKEYCEYLEKYVRRLLRNRNIPESRIPGLYAALEKFSTFRARSISEHELLGIIERFESEEIDPPAQ